MKRICLIVALVQMVFIATTALAQVNTADWKEVKGTGYSISFPNDWEVNHMGDVGVSALAMAPLDRDNDPFRENFILVVEQVEKDVDLKTYALQSSKQILASLPDVDVLVSKLKDPKTDPYYEMVYTVEKGGLTLRYAQFYFIKDGFAYVITLACELRYHENYEAIFDQIAAGFKLS